jgi:DNA/RNA endonuclease YhcR with UshA esterase domain
LWSDGSCRRRDNSEIDFNEYSGSVRTIKKNTEALLVASEKIGIEISAEKNKYVFISRQQNAGKNNDRTIVNIMASFEYVGRALTIKIAFLNKSRPY